MKGLLFLFSYVSNVKRIHFLLFLQLFLLMLVTGCDDINNKGMPVAKGRTGEVLIISTEGKWNGPVGDTIRKTLGAFDPSLSQPEKIFTTLHIDEDDFVRMFRRHYLILIVNIKPDIKTPGIENIEDVWASPQRVIRINAPSDSAFIRIYAKYRVSVMELFHKNEIRRFRAAFSNIQNLKLKKKIEQKLGINLIVPSDYYLAKEKRDFMWIRKETVEYSQGILIYIVPYNDSSQLNPLNIKALRDRFTKLNIPGPSTGSYMLIADDVVPLSKRRTIINGHAAVEIQGLWKIQGDFMGGPFINYTMIDKTHQRIITLDGFVYYPNKDKKIRIRELEAILQSITFPTRK